MASIGVVNAATPSKDEANEDQNRNKYIYFGVFFDGTGQNMVQTSLAKKFRHKVEDEVNLVDRNDETFSNGDNQTHQSQDAAGYSNIAILHSVYQSMAHADLDNRRKKEDIGIFNIYVEGPGGLSQIDGKGDNGVTNKVGKAMAMVRERLSSLSKAEIEKTELHFVVYGFSRGSADARLFSFMTLKGSSTSPLACESAFKQTLAKRLMDGDTVHFLDKMRFKDISIDFLGLYDTVSSIGGISIDTYVNNTTDYGLYSPILDKVKSTCHLCAMDEFREHFALTDLGDAANKGENLELFIPGCHSDVGGSYKNGTDRFTLKPNRNFLTGQTSRYFSGTAVNRSNKKFIEMNLSGLRKLGWVTKDKEYNYDFSADKITVTRYVPFGYSNLPLYFMYRRSSDKTQRKTFNPLPPQYAPQLRNSLKGMMSYLVSTG